MNLVNILMLIIGVILAAWAFSGLCALIASCFDFD